MESLSGTFSGRKRRFMLGKFRGSGGVGETVRYAVVERRDLSSRQRPISAPAEYCICLGNDPSRIWNLLYSLDPPLRELEYYW